MGKANACLKVDSALPKVQLAPTLISFRSDSTSSLVRLRWVKPLTLGVAEAGAGEPG